MISARRTRVRLTTALTALAVSVSLAHVSHARAQTTVGARAPDATRSISDTTPTATPEDVFAELPGTALVHDGGPLAPVRPVVRGLGGPRVDVTLGGLSLADPLDGAIDLAGLPWAGLGVVAVDALAGKLRLEPDARTSRVHTHVLAGELATLRAGAGVAVPTPDGALLVAAEGATTSGDYQFRNVSASGAVDAPQRRANADQRRASALALARAQVAVIDARALAYGAAHDGGVPGFAAHPTANLRATDATGGARVSGAVTVAPVTVDAALSLRGTRRETHDDVDIDDAISSAAGSASTGAVLTLDAATASARAGVSHARVLTPTPGSARASGAITWPALSGTEPAGSVERTGGSLATAVTLPFVADVVVSAAAEARMLTDVGALFSGRLVVARPALFGVLDVEASLARRARPPTLDELYAPRGLVLGNPALRPEAIDDAELLARVRLARMVQVRAAAFAGVVEDAILYLNRNAYEVAPANTGPAFRAGLDTSVALEPSEYVGITTGFSLLASRVDVTGAPLPLAPPFVAVTTFRIGEAAGARAEARFSSRAAASANLFGSLVVPGYTLFDLAAVFPLGEALALGVAMDNVLDIQTARDQHGLPLPGRLVFASLTVSR